VSLSLYLHIPSSYSQRRQAKKRQLIEQRLQDKLRKETDSVRRAEEVKKDKNTANRKEEELQLNDSIVRFRHGPGPGCVLTSWQHKLRRIRLPLLANFLSTSDNIPASTDADMDISDTRAPLAPVPRAHPPPLYYLPARLTPAQEAFLQRRKTEVKEAAEQEWETFRTERTAGVEELATLRQRVAEEDARRRSEQEAKAAEKDKDAAMAEDDRPAPPEKEAPPAPVAEKEAMDVDDGVMKEAPTEKEQEREIKEEAAPMQADDDDAVEY